MKKQTNTRLDADTQRKLDAARAEYNARKAQAKPVEAAPVKRTRVRAKPVEATPPVQKNFLHRAFAVPADYSMGESLALIMVGKRREDSWSRIIAANVVNLCTAFGIAWIAPYIGFGLALAAMTLTTSMFVGLAVFYVSVLIGFWYALKLGQRAFHWVRTGQADFDCAMLGVKASVKVSQIVDWFKPKSDEQVLAAAGA